MPEIQPHPFGRAPWPAIRDAQRALRRGSLQFVRQRIVIAPIAIVQEASDRAMKVPRAGCQFVVDGAAVEYFPLLPAALTQPNRRLEVTESPRRLFYIRLQVKDGIAVSR